MRPQPTRVAIDLETTGLHVEQDAIIEIGAVKFAGDAVIETFETLIMPGIPLPYRIQRLTGITPTQLKGAPTLVTALPQLRAFLGDLPLVGHNIAFDVAFLRRVGLARRNPQMDTYELASILLPRLRSYTLAAVADALAIPNETHHRALADAQLARHVLLALLQRLDALDTGILEALDALVAPPDWAPRAFLRATLRERRGPPVPADGGFGGRLTTSFGELLASKLEVAPDVLTLAIARRDGETAPTLTSPLLAAPAPDAAEAATLAALHESVADCLEAGGTLLLEAAATEGHLLACLEPAVRWAASREECLLIATADVERMTHVAGAALPQARARAGIAAEALIIAALAEREAYLCPHRWYGHARAAPDGPLSREITRGLAKLVSWVRETRTGLRSEVTLSGPEAQAWELARAGEEFADSWEGCPYRRDGYCFAARAREAARTARVVVTTHAALAAMLMGRDTALPAAARVIVLEAPLLEEELRRVGSFALDREALLGLLAALASSEPGGQRTGLLPLAAARLGSAGGQHHTRAWFEQVARARATAEAFFAALAALLAESAGATSGGRRAQGEAPDPRLLRIDARVRTLSAWSSVPHTWAALARELTATVALARETARALHAVDGGKKPLASNSTAVELLGIARQLEQACHQGQASVNADENGNEVHWLRVPYPINGETVGPPHEPPRRKDAAKDPTTAAEPAPGADGSRAEAPAYRAPTTEAPRMPVSHRAPVHIGSYLAPLSTPDRGLVLTGAALAVGGDFEHLRGMLGLPERVRTLAITPDREAQTLLCLPSDVSEPNAPHYQQHLETLLVRLGTALGGRVVALFPSHAALRAASQGIRRNLERHDILVLAQGQDGSARQLWHTFTTQPRTLLLGAGAFWSGREPIERPPACVVVTRLPFPALSDPLLAARAELWEDPHSQFVVPQAALKLRQALNGLAWSHDARNAVVLFDRRLQTRDYGQTILGTLPRCAQREEPAERLVEHITEWVGV